MHAARSACRASRALIAVVDHCAPSLLAQRTSTFWELPPEAAGAQHFSMVDGEALAAGERPGPVEDLRPQGAFHGHNEAHIEQPSLDVPGLQMTQQGVVQDHELQELIVQVINAPVPPVDEEMVDVLAVSVATNQAAHRCPNGGHSSASGRSSYLKNVCKYGLLSNLVTFLVRQSSFDKNECSNGLVFRVQTIPPQNCAGCDDARSSRPSVPTVW